MTRIKHALLIALTAMLIYPLAAGAGPIFNLIGSGGSAPLHPDGDDSGDRMVVSSRWGIAATGGGFMDGQIEFRDGFLLPTLPGNTVSFGASDIAAITFAHTLGAFGTAIAPVLGFSAGPADIVAASGTIVLDSGGEYAFSNSPGVPSIVTSVGATVFGLPAGLVTGDWEINGEIVTLRSATGALDLVPGSQTSGRWELTGFTMDVPEPSALLLSGLACVLLPRRRVKKRSGDLYSNAA